ncbi:hypothetical protein SAMN05421743_103313 [Thalassobacillus cyri]|uniref:Sporulation protein YpjB n=1 Tax=Thalassobacillus cyri TaxID=571932 RepID=A0A1H3ZPV1_9BACI|nr:hypothetical protein [Thalassobacillus cyri]SEA25411.1 hypothetical protein SAMN05421743_103313 [Thalassobacillus cyri]
MKKFSLFIAIMVLLTFSIQSNAAAYSYGDPSEEKIAQVYEKMVAKLNQSPPDFEEAEALFNTVKEEVDMHMGKEASELVLNSIEEEDKEATINNMQKLLGLNIARRLNAIENNFEEYDTSKKLLAKGFATYKALSPAIEEQDSELDAQIREQFDLALDALGNPGLFGVGEKESDKEQYLESKSFILEALKEPLNIEEFNAGHFTGSATAEENDNQSTNDKYTDFTEWKNWLPLIVLIGVIIAVVLYFLKRRKRS